jgi:hypothetical protein
VTVCVRVCVGMRVGHLRGGRDSHLYMGPLVVITSTVPITGIRTISTEVIIVFMEAPLHGALAL